MSDTEEAEVLQLLYNYKNEDKITNLPEYPLTDPNFVRRISQSITDILYNSYKNKSLSSKRTRETIIELLKKLIEPSSHVPINESNYNIFIKCLSKEPQPLHSFYQKYGEDFIKVSTETSKLKRKKDWDNICETVNKKYMNNLEYKIKSGFIQTWNKSQFEKKSFDYNGPNKTFQNPDVEDFLEFIKGLKYTPEIIIDTNKCESINILKTSMSKDESNVQLAYSLLNIERNPENESLFYKVLENIYLSKTETGLRFIEYIWTNKDNLKLSPEIYIKTLKYFKHVYEKPIITLATEVLENLNEESSDYEYEILIDNSDIIKNILKTCDLDLELCSNVIFVLNKLLALSRFDLRLFKLLNIVKNYIHKK